LHQQEAEGGCGVIGFAANEPIAGRHLILPLTQMHNRGNGKGGGIAAAGCFPDYKDFYALHIGYLDPAARREIERNYITPFFEIEKVEKQPSLENTNHLKYLEIKPPEVWRYFCRVKRAVLTDFARQRGFNDLAKAEDQFVYENSFNLSKNCYADLEDKKAFVLSHGKNLMVLKGVGYAEEIARYYLLEDIKAYVWIGHQRYPTRGRVWHPGGAHPFVGLNEALVHNGDFANYFSVKEYLEQRDIHPLYLTDTEVAALLFDFYTRVLEYPLEETIEAIAPTTERDFDLLPRPKQRLYRAIRTAHIHGSPDGPWFFIIARSLPYEDAFQLIGITDTSMLRPHVFSLSFGEVCIGAVASEKQAIDALLLSLSREDGRICPVADRYWSSRGGSHTDGGAFIFTVKSSPRNSCQKELVCTDKFGRPVEASQSQLDYGKTIELLASNPGQISDLKNLLQETNGKFFEYVMGNIQEWDYETFREFCESLIAIAKENDSNKQQAIETLTLLRDRRYNTGRMKRNWLLAIIDRALEHIFLSTNSVSDGQYCLVDFQSTDQLTSPHSLDRVLLINARNFPQEGEESVSRLIVKAYNRGFRRFIAFNLKGDRFLGCGLGPNTGGVRIDVYGSSGDYLGSGLDGAEIYVHGDAQDQVGQILNSGKIVIYGNVGQTFLYGAKGGEVYVFGNTAGRPLINSVGQIRAIINGTCLDYAAESFMAGEELGGGFLIINGFYVNLYGEIMGLEDRYPGGNFFSLASGGAGYVNDPYHTLTEDQLNGAEFVEFTQDDWNVILPYLKENERLFGIMIDRDILTVDRVLKWPQEVYRKVVAKRT
ncbi:MAG: glutamate synthase, partial [candidate division KSB1 bacterium]|nr:glutamate synthase [candidate division KSB1 bacterium]